MNVIFHVTTAVGLTVALADTLKVKTIKDSFIPAICAFGCGVIVHGILDYLPHTYPFSAKSDMLISLIMIGIILYLSHKKYLLIILSAILGCILPDLIDLLPPMLNKYIGLNIPVDDKLFPWHAPEYSGSIFTGTSNASDINHITVILITGAICWCRRTDFENIFIRKKMK